MAPCGGGAASARVLRGSGGAPALRSRCGGTSPIGQPAVSQQLARLERELGVNLLDRSSRRVRLTPAGSRFLPEARAVLAAVERARSTATDATPLEPVTTMRIGSSAGLGDRLARVLGELEAMDPPVVAELVTAPHPGPPRTSLRRPAGRRLCPGRDLGARGRADRHVAGPPAGAPPGAARAGRPGRRAAPRAGRAAPADRRTTRQPTTRRPRAGRLRGRRVHPDARRPSRGGRGRPGRRGIRSAVVERALRTARPDVEPRPGGVPAQRPAPRPDDRSRRARGGYDGDAGTAAACLHRCPALDDHVR